MTKPCLVGLKNPLPKQTYSSNLENAFPQRWLFYLQVYFSFWSLSHNFNTFKNLSCYLPQLFFVSTCCSNITLFTLLNYCTYINFFIREVCFRSVLFWTLCSNIRSENQLLSYKTFQCITKLLSCWFTTCKLNKQCPSGTYPDTYVYYSTNVSIAQSFSPFSSRDGRQVRRPDPTRATNLFSKI
jgi:hypothetical protein